jgi:hypothetical protein
MSAARIVALVAGILICVATTSSVLRTLVVPRGLTSVFARTILGSIRSAFRGSAHWLKDYEARDALLAWSAPLGVLALLVGWLASYFIGYGLIEYATLGSLGTGFREAGSSLFTLGFASTAGTGPTAVEFLEAATGPVVIALQIAYLPTLYAAYNRRETDVTLLQSRAGEPAWGPEILARHQIISTLDALRPLYRDWERWAADVSESHTSYPMLVYFRSPEPLRSWIVGMLAVMDAAALHLALCPREAPSEARMCLRMSFVCLRHIAKVIGLRFDADPRPDAAIDLTEAEFGVAVGRLDQVGFPMERSAAEAWPHFHGWRVNYESLAYAIAREVDAVPALWSGPRRHLHETMPPVRPPNRRPESLDDIAP